MAFGIYQFYRLFQSGFRRQRIELFLKLFHPVATTRILDIGGYAHDWDSVPIESPITLLNLEHQQAAKPLPKRFVEEIGDGCALRYADKSFDIAYSNSVIEHLQTFENQIRFAAEIRRVGRQMFVQTPNRWFPIELHFVTAFIHYLPAVNVSPQSNNTNRSFVFKVIADLADECLSTRLAWFTIHTDNKPQVRAQTNRKVVAAPL